MRIGIVLDSRNALKEKRERVSYQAMSIIVSTGPYITI